jgi:hypothetical protein
MARLKCSRTVPIFKAGRADLCDNYRPISLLSTLYKILEKMVCVQLVNHLDIYIHNLFALKIAPTFLPNIFTLLETHFSTILYTLAVHRKQKYILIRQRVLEHRRHSSASPLSVRSPAALHMKIKYLQNLRFYQLHLYSTVIISSRFLILDDSHFTIFLSNSSNILTFYCSPYMVKTF